ncbi:MAG: hypothetical protein ACREXS_13990, partial [Gammaproteobacteria bacterium]
TARSKLERAKRPRQHVIFSARYVATMKKLSLPCSYAVLTFMLRMRRDILPSTMHNPWGLLIY